MTFKQALELKANVITGEKGTQIVYADTFLKDEENQDGETIANRIPFLKTYTVFNDSQIKGLPASYAPATNAAQKNSPERMTWVEEFFAQTGADIYTGTKAAYSVTTDRIQVPPMADLYHRQEGDYFDVLIANKLQIIDRCYSLCELLGVDR